MTVARLNVALATLWLASSNPAGADDTPTGTFQIGAGFSTDESFIAEAKLAQPDLFHTGTGLELSALISALRQDMVLGYNVPDVLGSGLDLHAELFDRRRTYPWLTRDGAGGAVELGHQLSRRARVYVRYGVEHVDVQQPPSDATARAVAPLDPGNGVRTSLGAGLAYTTLDMPFLPKRGTRFELYAESSHPALARVHAELDHARPLGPLTLRAHGHATYVRAPGGVPLGERLFHDGQVDVLGYPLGSIGTGYGDNLEASGRLELEVPLVPCAGLSIAGFAAAGVRYNTDAAYGPVQGLLLRSVGLSLIWRSPIGPLRFDWARPLDGNAGWVFGFGIGAL